MKKLLAAGKRILKEIGRAKGFTHDEIKTWVQDYHDWLLNDDEEIPSLEYIDNIRQLYIAMASEKSFQGESTNYYHIVLGLLSCPTSEAACERGFWLLKRTIQNERSRTKLDLLKARMINQSFKK